MQDVALGLKCDPMWFHSKDDLHSAPQDLRKGSTELTMILNLYKRDGESARQPNSKVPGLNLGT